MLETAIGGVLAVVLYILFNYNFNKFVIGQKVYYYIDNKENIFAGRIIAIVTCVREEDATGASFRRIIPISQRKVTKSEYKLFEVKPIVGGEKIVLTENKIYLENPLKEG